MPYKRGWVVDGRNGETIGGGYAVLRRGSGNGRLKPSRFPFEYATADEAALQAGKLAEMFPGKRFDVVEVVESHFVPDVEAIASRVTETA